MAKRKCKTKALIVVNIRMRQRVPLQPCS